MLWAHGSKFDFFSSRKEPWELIFDSKPSEIAKRAAIFTAVGQIGSMFAGIMMTAMNKSLHSNAGLKGWQWVFIISESRSE